MAALAGVAAWPAAVVRNELAGLGALVGVLGCLLLAGAVAARRAVLIAPALGLVGAEYALLVAADQDALTSGAPLVAAGLLAAGELAAWSTELRAAVVDEPGTWWRRVALMGLEAAAAYVTAAAVMAVVDAGLGEGIVLEVAGVAALAAGALAVVRLARRN